MPTCEKDNHHLRKLATDSHLMQTQQCILRPRAQAIKAHDGEAGDRAKPHKTKTESYG